MTQRGALSVLVLILLLATGFNTYQGLENGSRITGTLKASAATRVTTVTSRCELTQIDAAFAAQTVAIVGQFVPQAYKPFEKLEARYAESYRGCEAQLKLVKQINAHAP